MAVEFCNAPFVPSRTRRFAAGLSAGALAILLLSGCDRDRITAYDAPKDAPPPPPDANPSETAAAPPLTPPEIRWRTLPEGWVSRGPAGLRVANFTIPGPEGREGDLAVIPLPGAGGTDLDLVNLWRGQLGLEPIPASDLASHTEAATVAGQPLKLFNIVGSEPSDASAGAKQILVAALPRDGFTWFFKVAGDRDTVQANREPLKAFLGQLEFPGRSESAGPATSPSPSPAAARRSAPATGPTPKWNAPEAWKPVPAPQMVLSKWTVNAGAGAPADVTVSVFPGDTGGLVANLNRWRGQVGLEPAPEHELLALKENFDVLGGKATLVDLTGSSPADGQPSRLVGAIVRREPNSWFYKLLGPANTVEAQHDAFLKFVQSVQY